MNWVDLVWLFAVLTGVLGGLRSGVLSEVIRLAVWTVAVFVTIWLSPCTQWAVTAGVVAGLLVLSWGIRKIVHLIAGPPSLLSRLGGLVLGAARMTALMILLTLALGRLQTPVWLRQLCAESRCSATVLSWFHNLPATEQTQRTI